MNILNKLIITTIIALTSLTALAQQSKGKTSNYQVTGSVVDSFTGEAIDSCEVTVWNADSSSVVGSTYNASWGFRIDMPYGGG